MHSAFGVDHGGEISKREAEPSGGRYATSWLAPGVHGAIAGKKGRKLRAAGTEVGSSLAGGAAGVGAGMAVGRMTHNPHVASATSTGLGFAGSMLGTRHAQMKGHYKKQNR